MSVLYPPTRRTSRRTTISAAYQGSLSSSQSRIAAASSISLSASGSASLPNRDSTCQRRARKPSTWSVTPATRKIQPAAQLEPSSAFRKTRTKTGTSASLRIVSAFGICASGAETARVAMTPKDSVGAVAETVTLPGFVNAHSHTFQRALRGRAAGGDFWAWREVMLGEAERQTPESVREQYEATYREMRHAGYTAV